jgi:hypothetical protein
MAGGVSDQMRLTIATSEEDFKCLMFRQKRRFRGVDNLIRRLI